MPDSSANYDKHPHQLKKGLWVFPPTQNFNAVRSWWIECAPEPVLIDCPEVNQSNIELLKELAKGRQALILLTHRDAHGRVRDLQKELGWSVIVQEQEAYLLPELNQLISFSNDYITRSGLRLLWTPGPTPGSCVVHCSSPCNVLFCGRLLIPVKSNQLVALRSKNTFHWTLQRRSLEKLREWIPSDPRPLLASSGSNRFSNEAFLVEWDAWKYPSDLN